MSDLICPKCKKYGLLWLDPEVKDIATGEMECLNPECKLRIKGFDELRKLYEEGIYP